MTAEQRRMLGMCAVLAAALAGCDTRPETDAGVDSGPGVDAGDLLPDAGTDAGSPDAGPECDGPPGLYMDGACTVLSPGVRAYVPRFELWADGADKERYIFLPAGGTITTSDPDNWVFPVGTVIYKTFLRGGVRLETRILRKTSASTGPGAWDMRVYAWNAAQDAVTDVTNEGLGERQNVLGTTHDIPSGVDCVDCHRATVDTVNGFSAIQLNHDLGGLDLATLTAEGLLSDPPSPADADVPGDGAVEEGLGYLHANCAHCHRFTLYDTPSAGMGTCNHAACSTGFRMWLRVSDVAPADTDTLETGLGVRSLMTSGDAYCRLHPGEPTRSMAHVRMSTRGDFLQMPPLATEVVHSEGAATISAFISALSGDATNCVAP